MAYKPKSGAGLTCMQYPLFYVLGYGPALPDGSGHFSGTDLKKKAAKAFAVAAWRIQTNKEKWLCSFTFQRFCV